MIFILYVKLFVLDVLGYVAFLSLVVSPSFWVVISSNLIPLSVSCCCCWCVCYCCWSGCCCWMAGSSDLASFPCFIFPFMESDNLWHSFSWTILYTNNVGYFSHNSQVQLLYYFEILLFNLSTQKRIWLTLPYLVIKQLLYGKYFCLIILA